MTGQLHPSDPSSVAGYRLLGRIGAGGMGVVYLGRTEAGALAAVKVIQAEYADDDEFLARFRREVSAARRVESEWAVPVLGADTEAERPWMATAYVPGPSLAEAVTRCGPLPARSVRVLGTALARALEAVHAAGLVHRDVKPGNVLLGRDGPRLIDFGIARAADATTALTSAGMVVGTPGFLAPELAAGGGAEPGPAGDVFSLGCLLAYAATGRPPFGTGASDALLYRTVHDEPDLEGLDEELRPLVRECLAKDPELRPAPRELAGRLAGDPAADPLGWLPESVVLLIAERSARMLDLPDVEPTRAEPVAPTARPGRRRLLAVAAGGAAVLAAGGGAAVVWNSLRGAGGPSAAADRWIIGVHADLSGPGRVSGREQERGVRLAVEEYNARPDRLFELAVTTADDGGSPERAVGAASELADEPRLLAVIGPTGDPEAEAALPRYEEAMLPLLAVSPGHPSLAGVALPGGQSRVLLHLRPSDLALSVPIGVHLFEQAGVQRPGLIQDRSTDLESSAVALATSVMARDAGHVLHPRVVPPGVHEAEGFGPVVTEMLEAGIDSFVFAGLPEGAAAVARELAAAGFTGPRIAPQSVLDPLFLEQAGDAAEGWLVHASFVDAAGLPAAEGFSTAYREEHGSGPGYRAAEAYDAAGMVIQHLAAAAADGEMPSRAALAPLLRESTYAGITKEFAFDPDTGDFAGEGRFAHEVRDGRFTFLGPV
ncbi:bifunctional serine/threonine-protein kinase/ABC transporter substrate-binding protein [Streptomyces sp. ACA25]|uniref:bifunctional serine/threonine-protein kinase/ABC transporter substrate-binding protein n=1 Tax=Streptomyces sp. ACA25 TaxID=3022596 RepID=UPI0023070E36|nr:bifunctional serine/threonine-protein kinase/ABC transporter substrate-binding protein [Streptomyces sp. ACA25]MDB1086577.1 bifunctional serine/threonine-protein kinase/ABC transporter substrate-binding protein [Streptomyces sp. ACA25]